MHENLKYFCGERLEFKNPFNLNGWTIATDCRVFVASKLGTNYPEAAIRENTKILMQEMIKKADTFTSLRAPYPYPIDQKTEKCYCKGKDIYECPECKGEGWVSLFYKAKYMDCVFDAESMHCPICNSKGFIGEEDIKELKEFIKKPSICHNCHNGINVIDCGKVNFGGRYVSEIYLYLVHTFLQEVLFFIEEGNKDEPLYFTHSLGVGAIMPIKRRE